MRDARYGRRRKRRLDGIVDGPFDRRRAEKPLDFLLPFSLYATCFSSPSALNLSGQSLHFFLFFPCHLVLFSLLPLGPCFRAPLGNPQIHPQILRPE